MAGGDEQRMAHKHLAELAPHLAHGRDAKFKEVQSFKTLATEKFPAIVDSEAYMACRAELQLYGVDRLRAELGGFVDEQGQLTVGTKPFNIFARVAAGVQQMEPDVESAFTRRQPWLGPFKDEFCVMVNKEKRAAATAVSTYKEEHGRMNEDEKEETKGKAGMSLRHEFLLIKDWHWEWFNILTPGLAPGGMTIYEAIDKLTRMKEAALYYTRNASIPWSKNIGMFFICYPHVGVNSLHMHIIDLEKTGPTFQALHKKLLSIDEVLRALRQEVQDFRSSEIEAVLTTEFQAFLKCVSPEERREYREMYFKRMTPAQKEKMRRGLLYNTVPLPWRRAKDPLQRLDERLRTPGRPILTFM
jgi:hypothetical protein